MKLNLSKGQLACLFLVSAMAATMVVPAIAETVLIDIGSNDSFRGADVVGADSNGNYWNSVWSGAFYPDLIDLNGNATAIDFGFSAAGGTDSYNGPAGATTIPFPPGSPMSPAEIAATDVDTAALGNLGGAPEASFDFYVSSSLTNELSSFEIQGLDPTKTYDLTFFGSHSYDDADFTTYSVYSDIGHTNLVGTVNLEHHAPFPGDVSLHNRDQVATISGLSPGDSDILYVSWDGEFGLNGYLNSLQIESFGGSTTTQINDFSNFTPVDTYGTWAPSTSFTQGADTLTVKEAGYGGSASAIGPNVDATGNTHVELDVTVNSADLPNIAILLADGDGTEFIYRWFSLEQGDHTLSFRLETLTNSGAEEIPNAIDQANSYPGDPNDLDLDLSTLSFFHIQIDPADPNSPLEYDVEFDNLRVKNVPGSFDTNESVNGRDFLLWQRGLTPNSHSAIDLAEWKDHYGSEGEAFSSAAAVVPEPTAVGLAILGSAGALGFRRRREVRSV